jgi:serine O-acetyltransferase
MLDLVREDWRNYHGDLTRQGLWVMLVYRFGNWRYKITNRFLRLPFSILYKMLKLGVQVLSGIDVPCEVRLGRRFMIEHFGGIIISGDAKFGDDCIIRNGVTVGLVRTDQRGSPRIGDRVDIGTGAKVLGDITVGDDVKIGANAVVTKDVPAAHVAVGVPAKIIPRKDMLPAADQITNVSAI